MLRLYPAAGTLGEIPSLSRFKQRVRELETDSFALYLPARHPATWWYARLLVAGIVAYAFSPIDLIHDFIPILGLIDDLVLLPVGIGLAIKLIPPAVMTECRARAAAAISDRKPASRIAAAVIIAIWIGLAVLAAQPD
jgi:uncharacterized membrane protein YkvA (DUF1232 family)